MLSADSVFDTLFAYRRFAALKSAIDLEVFTAIDEGNLTAQAIATRSGATERGPHPLPTPRTIVMAQKAAAR
jgi:hypothetical protein